MSERDTGSGPLVGGVILLLAGGGCGTWVFVFGLLGLIFSLVFPLAFGTPFDDLRLDRGAPLETSAEVLAVEIVPNTTVNNQAVYTLSYRFEAEGEAIEDQARVLEHDAVTQASPGEALTVEFLPEEPSVSRPVGSPANAGGWGGVIGFPFLALAVLGALPVALIFLAGGWLVWRALKAPR
jgi:hypothetical protein